MQLHPYQQLHLSACSRLVLGLALFAPLAACAGPRPTSGGESTEPLGVTGTSSIPSGAYAPGFKPAAPPITDPRQGEVLLPVEAEGWQASLIHDNDGVGIWTVESFPVFEEYACPEVIGLDDQGRAVVCVSYSGKWTPLPIIKDGVWLGGLEHGDLDARIDGSEVYTGGKAGHLYQVVPYPHGGMDYRRIADFPGCEIHTLVGGEVDASHEGPELLVFTRPGGLYRVSADGPDGTFRTVELDGLDGRVRDAVLLPKDPSRPNAAPAVAMVSRAGWLRVLHLAADGVRWSTVHEEPMGLGRISLGPGRAGAPYLLYSCLDDGRILRHAPPTSAGGEWTTELVHVGPQGPRGVTAGRFDPDPAVETVAIFGYGRKAQLLRRAPGEDWTVETLFVDLDKGHWLARAEVDGRNTTDELVLSGYSGRITLLARTPGTGLGSGVASRAFASEVLEPGD
ncbi:MAG: hypothetical protein P1V81_11680 [Planctomycetota bacterium]|nr:hypothetical protein [Planctomycetota bacterium]